MSDFKFAQAVLEAKAREINDHLPMYKSPGWIRAEAAKRDELLEAAAALAKHKEKAA